MLKKLLSLLLVLGLLAVLPMARASAQEDALPVVIIETYDGETTQTTQLSPEEAASQPTPYAAVYHDTLEAAAADLREQLKAGESPVVIGVQLPYDSSSAGEIFSLAVAHTGDPTEGDYLANHCRGYNASISGTGSSFTVTYTPGYTTTAQQEAQVDAKVAEILPTIRRDTDYHAVLDIFRWLKANVTYQAGDILHHTAYGALVNGTGVCESYASAFYRLALECGVDCRIVSGSILGGGHAWNIVKLDGLYYVVDPTNDIFLRCPASVKGLLVLDPEFEAGAFTSAYPMTTQDYTADIAYIYEDGTLTLPTTDSVIDFYRDVTDLLMTQNLGSIPNPDFKYSVAPWENILSQIHLVRLGGSPSFIPSRMFYWNDVVEAVLIPSSVKTIELSAFNSCVSMWSVYFTGTQAQWEAITIEDYNNTFTWATVFCDAEPVPDPHAHSYTASVTAPTCTAQGYTTYTCDCGDSYADAYVDALGHTAKAVAGKAATCTETGLTEGSVCSVCDAVITAQEIIPALGHSAEAVAGKVATCESTGLTDGSVCSVCGEVLTAQKIIPATGHSYENSVCGVCGEKDPNYVAPDPSLKQGLAKAEDGEYYYYVDGEIATEYTGFVENAAGTWYVENGHCNLAKDGVVTVDGTNYLIKAGHINVSYTGLIRIDGGRWLYFASGVQDMAYVGLITRAGMQGYVEQGEVNFNKSGVVDDNGTLKYVKYGIWRNTYKGLARTDDGQWLYFVNGAHDASYTGVAKLNANWVYVTEGAVNFTFSGTITVGAYNYSVKYGVVQF